MSQVFLTLRNPSGRFPLLPALFIGLCLFLCGFQATGQAVKKDVKDQEGKKDILIGSDLSEGFDTGVDSEESRTRLHRTNWLSKESDYMKMAFPANQNWAAVFVTVGEPTTSQRPSMDFSSFKTLSVEMRGAVGGERVEIGIKSNDQPDNGKETKKVVTLTPAWKVYEFPLSEFSRADLNHLYVVTEFVYNGSAPQTVYFKNIKYLR